MKEVEFGAFRHFEGLQQTMNTLVTTKYGDFKQSYFVKRFADEIEEEFKNFHKLHSETMAEAEWSKPEGDAKPEMLNKAHIDGRLTELFTTTFDMKWAPIPEAILETLNPTPEQYTVLGHFIDPIELEAT